MTFEQEARYDALQDTEVSKSVKIVSTADIRSGQWSDTISFRLPGRSDTLLGKTLQVALTDVLGRTVYTDNIAFDQEGFATIRPDEIGAGFYFLQVYPTSVDRQSIKLIITQN